MATVLPTCHSLDVHSYNETLYNETAPPETLSFSAYKDTCDMDILEQLQSQLNFQVSRGITSNGRHMTAFCMLHISR